MNVALRPLPTRVTQQQYEGLSAARERDGLSIQEHIRRALDAYLNGLELTRHQIASMALKSEPAEKSPEGRFQRRKPRVTVR